MSTITTQDGTQIYYKDWGAGQPVVFSHGWPLSADSREAQMVFRASNGYRCIAREGRQRIGDGPLEDSGRRRPRCQESRWRGLGISIAGQWVSPRTPLPYTVTMIVSRRLPA